MRVSFAGLNDVGAPVQPDASARTTWSYCSPKAAIKLRLVVRADEVGRDAAAGEERSEVDRRAVDRGVAAAGPLDLGDLKACALGGLGDRLRLENAWRERGRAGGKRLVIGVERVVRRPVNTRPCPRCEGVPACPRVRWRLCQKAVAARRRALLEERPHGRHDPAGGVLGDEILSQPIGREEDGLVAVSVIVVPGRDGCGREWDQQRQDGQQDDRPKQGGPWHGGTSTTNRHAISFGARDVRRPAVLTSLNRTRR